jgi:hypothetical protein
MQLKNAHPTPLNICRPFDQGAIDDTIFWLTYLATCGETDDTWRDAAQSSGRPAGVHAGLPAVFAAEKPGELPW